MTFNGISCRWLPKLLLRVTVLILAGQVAGCGDPRPIIESAVYAKRGGWSPKTEFEFYRSSWDRSIQEELAGQPAGGGQSWKEFWHDIYRAVRRDDEPALAERMVAYIHQQRQHYGLPTYDDKRPQ